jgi:hypothetical protein
MESGKRKRTRVIAHFEVIVTLDGISYPVKTLNLSLTGLLCVTNPRFRSAAPCRIQIKLADDVTINLEGKILRTDDREAAISFSSMDEESFFHLKRTIALNAPDADEIEKETAIPAFKP